MRVAVPDTLVSSQFLTVSFDTGAAVQRPIRLPDNPETEDTDRARGPIEWSKFFIVQHPQIPSNTHIQTGLMEAIELQGWRNTSETEISAYMSPEHELRFRKYVDHDSFH